MKKIFLFNALFISILLFLIGCDKQPIVNNDERSISGDDPTTISSPRPTKIPVTITPTPIPLNKKSISNILGLSNEWNPNHGIVSIAYEKVGDYDDCNEYVFISPTEGWKAYIGPIGAGQEFIVLYKTVDAGEHWKKIYEPPMGGGDIMFLNSKVGWMVHNWPVSGVVQLTKTLDGGTTWDDERISVPEEYSNVVFSVSLPVFFSQEDGIMFASCNNASQDNSNLNSVTFITHDGGENWRLNTKNDIDTIFTWSLTCKDGINSLFDIIYNNEEWDSVDNREWVKVSDK